MQTVIYEVSSTLLRLLTPILPFTMEEVHVNMPDYNGKSAQLLDYPKVTHNYDEQILKDYEEFKAYRDEVNKQIELVRAQGIIGSSQEALVVSPKAPILIRLGFDKNIEELTRLLIVSKVELSDKNVIEVHHIDAQKCPRCWNYVDKLYKVDDETEVCKRCYEVLTK